MLLRCDPVDPRQPLPINRLMLRITAHNKIDIRRYASLNRAGRIRCWNDQVSNPFEIVSNSSFLKNTGGPIAASCAGNMNVLPVQLIRGIRERASSSDRADDLQRFSPIRHYKSPLFKRPAIWSAVRDASAMIVCVGFFSDADGNTLPSTTNKFGTSCVWQKAFTTDVFGSDPMRASAEFVIGPRLAIDFQDLRARAHQNVFRPSLHVMEDRHVIVVPVDMTARARQPPIVLLYWIQIDISLRRQASFRHTEKTSGTQDSAP